MGMQKPEVDSLIHQLFYSFKATTTTHIILD